MKTKHILFPAAAILILVITAVGCSAQSQRSMATATSTTAANAVGLPVIGSYQPASACDHPYYPRRAGTKKQIDSDGSTITETTNISGDMDNATATVTTTSTGGVDVKIYECNPDGIFLTDWKSYNGDKQIMSTLSYSGLFFPTAEQFKIGEKWEYSIVTHKELDNGWIESETKRSCTVAALTSIQYQSKDIDALQVGCVNEVKDLKASGGTELQDYYDVYIFYYVYGVGIAGYKYSK